MIITTIAELNALPTGKLIYDRDFETYRKRADGRWAYPAKSTTMSIAPNGMLRYGPMQTLESLPPEPIGEVNGATELEELPEGTVIEGANLIRKREDGRWDVAGKARPWTTDYLVTQETFPLQVLKAGVL